MTYLVCHTGNEGVNLEDHNKNTVQLSHVCISLENYLLEIR